MPHCIAPPAPQGRNVVLESKFGSPKIVNDGVTIAKEVELEDPVENIGAKLVRQVGVAVVTAFDLAFVSACCSLYYHTACCWQAWQWARR